MLKYLHIKYLFMLNKLITYDCICVLERKEEYQKIADRTYNKIHELAHIKEFVNFSKHKYTHMYEQYNFLLAKLHEKRVLKTNHYNQHIMLLRERDELRNKCGLLANKPMLMEYDNVTELIELFQTEIKQLLARISDLQLNLSKYETLLEQEEIKNDAVRSNARRLSINQTAQSVNLRKLESLTTIKDLNLINSDASQATLRKENKSNTNKENVLSSYVYEPIDRTKMYTIKRNEHKT